ncbi:MAG: CoA transferase [Deltaproteobacteria bacterium]|nr:CoA transferase [Deltaproteobacteria bacterium]
MSKLPLEGIVVLDFATLLAGPVATTFLGDFGATVIKIEKPEVGDATRRKIIEPDGRGAGWLIEGRNKKPVTLDLHTDEGQKLAHKLAAKADVAVINFRPGQAEEWNIGAEDLHKTNPGLIILQVSAYGQTGPYSRKGGFDRTASAFAGLTYVTGYPDQPPVRSGYATIDYMTAYLGAFGVMMALYNRAVNNTGGEVIDVNLAEAGFRASESALTDYSLTGRIRERTGNRNLGVVPADDFKTKDGRILVINAGVPTLWSRIAHAMGKPELLEDPRFEGFERLRNQEQLYEIIAGWVKDLTADEALKILDEAKVPADIIRNIEDLAHDPHMRAREAVMEIDDPEKGKVLVPGVFPKLTKHPGEIKYLGIKLGECNQEIYGDFLGLSSEEIKTLEKKGVI